MIEEGKEGILRFCKISYYSHFRARHCHQLICITGVNKYLLLKMSLYVELVDLFVNNVPK